VAAAGSGRKQAGLAPASLPYACVADRARASVADALHCARAVRRSGSRRVGEESSRVCVLCVCTHALGARAAAARISYVYSEARTEWQAPQLMGGAASQVGLPGKPYQSVSLLAACSLRRWRHSLPTLSLGSWSTSLNNVSTCIPINHVVCISPGCECTHI